MGTIDYAPPGATNGGSRAAIVREKGNNVKDEIIEATEIIPSPRGKKMIFNDELLETFKRLPKGKAARLSGTFGQVSTDERQKVVHAIKRHWGLVRNDRPSINFTPEGIPQVSVRNDTINN